MLVNPGRLQAETPPDSHENDPRQSRGTADPKDHARDDPQADKTFQPSHRDDIKLPTTLRNGSNAVLAIAPQTGSSGQTFEADLLKVSGGEGRTEERRLLLAARQVGRDA